MFSVGQRVWRRDGQRSGRVLECDGDRVYIAQDNGVELDFPAGDLTATPPSDTPAPGVQTPGAQAPGARAPTASHSGAKPIDGKLAAWTAATAVPVRILTPRDITPEHIRVLGVVPARTMHAVAAVFERRPGAGKFSALDVAAKLNVIAEVTAVPYRTMRQYSDRPGELGLLMGKGLADSRKSG